MFDRRRAHRALVPGKPRSLGDNTMIASTNTPRAALIAGLASLAACAQQPNPPATQTAAPAQGSGMSNMSGMSGMSGMGGDHAAMMAQCADMRRQMAAGTHPQTPGMAEMMRHCQEMESGMGNMPGMGGPAPAATRSR